MRTDAKYQVSWHGPDKKWYVYELPNRCRFCGHTSTLMERVRIGESDKGFDNDDSAIEWLKNLGVAERNILS